MWLSSPLRDLSFPYVIHHISLIAYRLIDFYGCPVNFIHAEPRPMFSLFIAM